MAGAGQRVPEGQISGTDAPGGDAAALAARYAGLGLEKYVMTKLFDRTFGTSTEDAVSDMDILEKIGLLQQFVKPHHLDIPKVLHNEASWLLAVKELQKINSFKAPREKLLCIMSCCQVINNSCELRITHRKVGGPLFTRMDLLKLVLKELKIGTHDILPSNWILARKSAQRSRVRKLQYISELERSVTTLQNLCLIEFYTSSWKRKPHQVIISRNDVSESQFNLVLNIELQQIIDRD
ncbi:Vacuolar protein sorting-associated protein 9A [Zea mays]|uniref:Vacuolar protein sorting-associated protein 9A n=1 Tax=Zea mays TaxID=4577 RepID=A0A1D6P344_MAIZE|nr:Vacuolar protein sorting-associated protein 9A [Zea mays]